MEINSIFGVDNYLQAVCYVKEHNNTTIQEITEQGVESRTFKIVTLPEYSNNLKALKIKWDFEQWYKYDWCPRDRENSEEWNEQLDIFKDDNSPSYTKKDIKTISELVSLLNESNNEELAENTSITVYEKKRDSLMYIFYVISVEENSVSYSYTNDDAFLSDVLENPVQIGFYKISAAEFTRLELERKSLYDELDTHDQIYESQMKSLLGNNWRN